MPSVLLSPASAPPPPDRNSHSVWAVSMPATGVKIHNWIPRTKLSGEAETILASVNSYRDGAGKRRPAVSVD